MTGCRFTDSRYSTLFGRTGGVALLPVPRKSESGEWRRRKGPAPPRPMPQRRVIRKLPLQQLQRELHDIEVQQTELERQGVLLEKAIRARTENTGSTWDGENIPGGSVAPTPPPIRGDHLDGATLIENDRKRLASPDVYDTSGITAGIRATDDTSGAGTGVIRAVDSSGLASPGADQVDNRVRDADVPDIVKDTPAKPPHSTSPSSAPNTFDLPPMSVTDHDNDSAMSGPSSLEVEDMIMQLFELVNLKNELFRRQTELMYL